MHTRLQKQTLLQLALQRLENESQLWLIFSGLGRMDYWRQSAEWAFYTELREQLDCYIGEHPGITSCVC